MLDGNNAVSESDVSVSKEIQEAMKSMKDEHGIPKDLYALDDSLLILMVKSRNTENKGKNNKEAVFKSGLITALSGIVLLAIEYSDPSDYYAYGGIRITWIAWPATGLGIYSMIKSFIKTVPEKKQSEAVMDPLIKYYNRKYKQFETAKQGE
ncbi:MAG: hypothetical protein KAI81_01705 [Candidatus Marinimicrobia bacterium]|nr:hypothetical protein [Candidatus Neomarinimicrobiota bacterium]